MSPSANSRVYVVLLNWHGAHDTITCLESLLSLQGCDFQIVVCENGSTDDSVECLRAWAAARGPGCMVECSRDEAEVGGLGKSAEVFLLHTGANLGFAGGCNVGIRFALTREDADYVWLLNNDTEVEPDALAALLRRANQTDHPGIVGSLLCFFEARDRVQSMGGGTYSRWRGTTEHIAEGQLRKDLNPELAREAEAKMAYVVGASMLVSREFLRVVGLMQEDYFLYYEEIDWAVRARRCATPFKLAVASDSIVYHKVGASAGTRQRSLFMLRHLAISRLRFVKRFYRPQLPIVRLVMIWESLKALLKGRSAEARLKIGLATSAVRI